MRSRSATARPTRCSTRSKGSWRSEPAAAAAARRSSRSAARAGRYRKSRPAALHRRPRERADSDVLRLCRDDARPLRDRDARRRGLFALQPASRRRAAEEGPWHLVSMLLSLAGASAIAADPPAHRFSEALPKGCGTACRTQQRLQAPTQRPAPRDVRNPNLRWDEIGVFVVLIAGTAVVLIARRKTKRATRPWRLGRNEEVSLAIDESIDDLRNDPDFRRAIVAAYARMEHALGRAGLPRHPAEAPFEYVERALLSLDTSSGSVPSPHGALRIGQSSASMSRSPR